MNAELPKQIDNIKGDDPEELLAGELRSFGRKRGRKLSPRQESLLALNLPLLTPDLGRPVTDRASVLTALGAPASCRELWLEIGFGGGEHLVWQARANPDALLIGCEPFVEGVVKVLGTIERDNLANIRLRNDDVRPLLRWLPPASIDRCFILFPDPWPKKRHVKRRLVSKPTLDLLVRVLRPGAELRLATDIADYARTMSIALQASPELQWSATCAADWRVRPGDWPGTRYEAKAVEAGRRCYYLSYRRR